MDRNLLRFPELVQKHFVFLEPHGFHCVRSKTTFVRFESSLLFLNIYHGRSSFEIGLELGRLGKDEDERQPYPMSALLGVAGVPTAREYRDYAARTPRGVDIGISTLANKFQEYIVSNFQNKEFFRLLKKQREIWNNDFAHEVNLRQVRRKLDAAWRTKDYEKVVELLEPLRAELTPVELKKLEYAKKK